MFENYGNGGCGGCGRGKSQAIESDMMVTDQPSVFESLYDDLTQSFEYTPNLIENDTDYLDYML